MVKAYLDEAKWYYEGYVPSLEEYMPLALVSCGFREIATYSFVGMGELATKEAFEWLFSDPLIVQASTVVCRLMDDMFTHEVRILMTSYITCSKRPSYP